MTFHCRGTAVQTLILESKEDPSQRLLVSTTHLFFHPKGNLVRLFQAVILLRHIEQLKQQYAVQGTPPSVVFCGDLNISPQGSVYEFITTRTLSADNDNVYLNQTDPNERILPDLNLTHSLDLSSACGIPEYTNFTTGFVSTLDHIFIETPQLETTQVVPMPTHEEVTQFVALPSVVFPSDHIALICDVKFNQSKAGDQGQGQSEGHDNDQAKS